ncbi:MAG: diaminopimelate decarboxylase [Flavobacteriales bacterium]|jgi:diaminopimelate decarboxylase
MQHFSRINGSLYIENVDLNAIAESYGSPCFAYSRAAIEAAYSSYANALGDYPGKICYAVKANSNIAILQVLAKLGSGFDIVSEGELRRVLKAGGQPEKIIFSGVGKTEQEMRFALAQNIACFNVESEPELEVLNRVALDMGLVAPISLRVNPDVDAKTHPYISTGLKENKFGIDIERAPQVYVRAQKLAGINISGVDCHIGSQLTEKAPFLDALERVLKLIDTLKENDIELKHIDLGGGLGICYKDEVIPDAGVLINDIIAQISGRGLELVLEPGRSIVGNAGVMLTEVIYLKPTEHRNFAIVDAAMNDNIRPALYQAWQNVVCVNDTKAEEKSWDLVGPICETGDFIAKDRSLALETGTRLAMHSSGAYCFAMSSNYNSRGRAAEVLIDGDQHSLIRRRESFDDLIANESLLSEARD